MFFLSKLIALLLVISGCVLILKPETIKKVMDYVKEGNRVYGIAVIRIVIGIILLLASSQARIAWVVFILGLLPVATGILVFVWKKEKSLKIAEQFISGSEKKGNNPKIIRSA